MCLNRFEVERLKYKLKSAEVTGVRIEGAADISDLCEGE